MTIQEVIVLVGAFLIVNFIWKHRRAIFLAVLAVVSFTFFFAKEWLLNELPNLVGKDYATAIVYTLMIISAFGATKTFISKQ